MCTCKNNSFRFTAVLMWYLLAVLFLVVAVQACEWGTVISSPVEKPASNIGGNEPLIGRWAGAYADTVVSGRLTLILKAIGNYNGITLRCASGEAIVEDNRYGASSEANFFLIEDNLYAIFVNARRASDIGEEDDYRMLFTIYCWLDEKSQTLRGLYDLDISGAAVGVHYKNVKGRIELYRVAN